MKNENKSLESLQVRFKANMALHPQLNWDFTQNLLINQPEKISVLYNMEQTGGEPNIVVFQNEPNSIYLIDCSPESPANRRSLCYDKQALDARKKFKPQSDALTEAQKLGVQLLSEDQYFQLQLLGNFDLKTSSWLLTPLSIREKGGAIFGDKRYGRTFIYHNGADSYYGSRGFRGIIKL